MRQPFEGGGRAGKVNDENCIPRAGRREGVKLGRGRVARAFPRMRSRERVGKKGSEKNTPCFALFCFALF